MIVLLWLVILFLVVALYLRKAHSRFSDYEVKQLRPVPLLGNVSGLMLKRAHLAEDLQILYQAFPSERFVGRFELIRPLAFIKDLDLIKKITVKDFEHFLDHRPMVDESVDTLFGRALFSLKGQEWKDMRSTLSPAFTSSKMRAMVPFMVEVNKQMISVLKNRIQQSETGYLDLDCKDLTTRYANDVIASCAFGLKVDSHAEEDNDFYLMGRSSAHFGFRRIMVFLGYSAFPSLMKKFNQKLYKDHTKNFFKDLVLSNMKEREINNIHRADMIHLLMEAKKGNLRYDERTVDADAGFATVEESDVGKKTVNRTWSDDDLISQAFLFFLAGFETVSSTMAFLLHELAVNPDVQDRLVQEIMENDERNGGQIDYSTIQNMTYMDMVVSEVLRLWPPVIGLDRDCIKDYNLGKPNDKAKNDFIVRKGESIIIPVWPIHRDPAHFPEPEKFDPERFSEKNKQNIKPFTYMPFGCGPRNCIGSRFALCEVKVMLYQLLQQLELSPCAKTSIPARLSKDTFTLSIEGGHWVRFTPRKLADAPSPGLRS